MKHQYSFFVFLSISMSLMGMQKEYSWHDKTIHTLNIALAQHRPKGDPKAAFKRYMAIRFAPRIKNAS